MKSFLGDEKCYMICQKWQEATVLLNVDDVVVLTFHQHSLPTLLSQGAWSARTVHVTQGCGRERLKHCGDIERRSVCIGGDCRKYPEPRGATEWNG